MNLVENISNYPNDNVYGGNDGRIRGFEVIINKISILTEEEYKKEVTENYE